MSWKDEVLEFFIREFRFRKRKKRIVKMIINDVIGNHPHADETTLYNAVIRTAIDRLL